MERDALLKVRHLKTYFPLKEGMLPAVDDVSFSVAKGEVLGVVGESGCGKSVMSLSILKLIEKYGGKIQPGSSILLNGQEILEMSDKQLRDLRGNEVAMIFQDPMTSLNPVFTIEFQMVETIRGHRKISRKDARQLALHWLNMVGIPDAEKRIREYPYQLSGGMRQRVIIAMALSCDPQMLIADEPTTALDVTIQAQIIDLLKQMKNQLHSAIMLITHDFGVVADMADSIMVMYAGKVLEYGTKEQIFKQPKHPYTQGLLAAIPRLDKNVERLNSIPGNVPNLFKPILGCVFCDRCKYATEQCRQVHPPMYIMEDESRVSCWLHQQHAKEVADES